MQNFLTLIALVICSMEDFKQGEIKFRWLLFLVSLNHLEAYFFLIPLALFYNRIEHLIGGADLLIFILLYSRYGYLVTFNIISLACFIGICYMLFFRKKEMRFIPSILVAYIASFLINGGLL